MCSTILLPCCLSENSVENFVTSFIKQKPVVRRTRALEFTHFFENNHLPRYFGNPRLRRILRHTFRKGWIFWGNIALELAVISSITTWKASIQKCRDLVSLAEASNLTHLQKLHISGVISLITEERKQTARLRQPAGNLIWQRRKTFQPWRLL